MTVCSKETDNPDLVYGRDFDTEPMDIEQITGEIGGVTIRGPGALLRPAGASDRKDTDLF